MNYIRTITLIFLGLIISEHIQAQSRIHFIDNFEDNHNGWLIKSTYDIQTEINGGSYIIKSIPSSYYSGKEIIFDSNNDFSIEVRLKQTQGADNMWFGINWGTYNWNNINAFNITSNGYYKVWSKNNGVKIRDVQGKSSAIIKKGENNVLKVVKHKSQMKFYVNGNLVHTDIFNGLYGTIVGFMVGKGVKIEVDYIIVKHPEIKIDLLAGGVSKYSKENMGSNINTTHSDIAPVISPDGKTLYIAQNKNNSYIANDSDYDIVYSTLQPDGTWSPYKNIGYPLNNGKDNVVIAVTPDNNTLMVEGLYNADGSYKSDQGISVSYRTASGWSVPKEIVIEDYYNKDVYESFCPTGDRQVIVMSVQRDDTYGKKDLYVSFLQPDGTYSKPKNMGPVLNSYDHEGTPFIAPDNKTMYFYSYTLPGYGSADIFVSKRLDDTWTKWSKPKNLGKKINTSDWDVYYTVAAKGDYAYLVSSKGTIGREDIFRIKLRDEEKPDPVVMIVGKVLDKKTNKPIATTITYKNTKTGKTEGYARSNPRDGSYKIILPYGVRYEIFAEKDNYFAMSEEMDLRTVSEYKEVKKDLFMAPIEKEETILLQNVHFYATRALLTPESHNELNRLAETMKKKPSMIIEIHGHTESTPGYEDKLMKLSERRVEAVRAYLENKGIAPERIKGKAFGGTQPIADNNTEEGRKQNRRVEFLILKK